MRQNEIEAKIQNTERKWNETNDRGCQQQWWRQQEHRKAPWTKERTNERTNEKKIGSTTVATTVSSNNNKIGIIGINQKAIAIATASISKFD